MATDKAVKAYLQYCIKTYESQIKKHNQKLHEEFEEKNEELYDVIADDNDNIPSINVLGEVLDYVKKAVTENTKWPNLQKESPDTNVLVTMCRGVGSMKDSYRDGTEEKMNDMLKKKAHQIHLVSIKAGPTTGHAEIMDTLQRYTDVGEYWETIEEDQLREIFKAFLASNPAPRHKMEEEDFGDIRSTAESVFEQFSEDQYKLVKTEAAELLMTSCERTLQPSEPASEYHYKICDKIMDKCFDDIKLYDLFPDNKVFLNHVDRMEAILLKEDFPTHSHVTNITQKIMYKFIKFIKHGLKGARRKEALAKLNKFFISINRKGNDEAKNCIESPYSTADYDFGNELAVASSGGDVFAAMTEAARNIRTYEDDSKFEKMFEKIFKENILSNTNPENMGKVIEFMVASLEGGGNKPLEMANKVLEKRKAIDLKAHPEYGTTFLAALKASHKTCQCENPSAYDKFLRTLHKIMKSQKVIGNYEGDMYEVLTEALQHEESHMHNFGYSLAKDIKWTKNCDRAIKVLDLILERIQSQPEVYQGDPSYMFYYPTLLCICLAFINTPGVAKIAPALARIFEFCKDQEWDHPTDSDKKSVHHQLLETIMKTYLPMSRGNDDVIKPMISYVKELWECGDEILEREANDVITMLSGRQADILGGHSDMLIEQYLDGSQPTLVVNFQEMYKTIPDKFHEKLDEILERMERSEEWVKLCTVGLFWEVAKNKPEVIKESHVDTIANHIGAPNVQSLAIMFLQTVAEREPHLVDKHGDALMAAMKKNKQLAAQGVNTLVPLACIDKAHAEKYTTFLANILSSVDSMFRVALLYGIKTVAGKCPDVVGKHKNLLQKSKKDPQLKDSAQAVLDTIEGRSLVGLEKEVKEQGEDIDQLDEKVTTTEGDVKKLDKAVVKTKKDIVHIKENVTKAEGKLDQLQDTVQETMERVEELEHMTLSHAPEWSRDVSKLLNPEAEHDWRLLSQRLGYSDDDIRNWATQPDPCMSMLDEWFATNKTREATYAVLKNLKEMNRTDAAEIVQRALKAVEDIIKDQPKDYANPPPVFISYQWGHQQEVKLLKRHLQSAGFEGWMDIGQMGGGDKLYEKIDQGVRAAKVVICCVSEKYAESPNCNREVNLCTTIGKPIIPLLMEKMAWPPPGSMGPIFGEYLFIRFFQRSGEETGDNRYWPAAKFQELLMQLSLNLVPDPKLITNEYKGWWDPPEEEIVIKPRKEKKATGSKKSGSEKAPALPSPSVFISYQWGKQPQIKALYRRLTQSGYHCWLDIMQMGGGDSLYDKIDKGVRGCKVVVSCVTTKYALSANCRREVSLADALKKPIVPLLLEHMAWPPEGPMSMPFTQLLYINFCKPDAEIQNHWECPQFEELLEKIREQVPNLDFDPAEISISTKTKSGSEEASTTKTKPAAKGGPGKDGSPKKLSRVGEKKEEHVSVTVKTTQDTKGSGVQSDSSKSASDAIQDVNSSQQKPRAGGNAGPNGQGAPAVTGGWSCCNLQ